MEDTLELDCTLWCNMLESNLWAYLCRWAVIAMCASKTERWGGGVRAALP